MKVTKVDVGKAVEKDKTPLYTVQELTMEYGYARAEEICKKLLEMSLVTPEEYAEIMRLNKESFHPRLSAIIA